MKFSKKLSVFSQILNVLHCTFHILSGSVDGHGVFSDKQRKFKSYKAQTKFVVLLMRFSSLKRQSNREHKEMIIYHC